MSTVCFISQKVQTTAAAPTAVASSAALQGDECSLDSPKCKTQQNSYSRPLSDCGSFESSVNDVSDVSFKSSSSCSSTLSLDASVIAPDEASIITATDNSTIASLDAPILGSHDASIVPPIEGHCTLSERSQVVHNTMTEGESDSKRLNFKTPDKDSDDISSNVVLVNNCQVHSSSTTSSNFPEDVSIMSCTVVSVSNYQNVLATSSQTTSPKNMTMNVLDSTNNNHKVNTSPIRNGIETSTGLSQCSDFSLNYDHAMCPSSEESSKIQKDLCVSKRSPKLLNTPVNNNKNTTGTNIQPGKAGKKEVTFLLDDSNDIIEITKPNNTLPMQCLYFNSYFSGNDVEPDSSVTLAPLLMNSGTDRNLIRCIPSDIANTSSHNISTQPSSDNNNIQHSIQGGKTKPMSFSRSRGQTFNGLETIHEAESVVVIADNEVANIDSIGPVVDCRPIPDESQVVTPDLRKITVSSFEAIADGKEIDSLCYNSLADTVNLDRTRKSLVIVEDCGGHQNYLSSNSTTIFEAFNSHFNQLPDSDLISVLSEDSLCESSNSTNIIELPVHDSFNSEVYEPDSLTITKEESDFVNDSNIGYSSSPQSPLLNTVTANGVSNTVTDIVQLKTKMIPLQIECDIGACEVSNSNNLNIDLTNVGLAKSQTSKDSKNMFDSLTSNMSQDMSMTSEVSGISDSSYASQASSGSFFGRVRKTYAPCTRNRKCRTSLKNGLEYDNREVTNSESIANQDANSIIFNGINITENSSVNEDATSSESRGTDTPLSNKLKIIKETLAKNQLTLEDFASSSLRCKYYCLEKLASCMMEESLEHRYTTDDCDYDNDADDTDDDSMMEDVKIEAINVALVNRYIIETNKLDEELVEEVLGNSRIGLITDSNEPNNSCELKLTQKSCPNATLPVLSRLPSPQNIKSLTHSKFQPLPKHSSSTGTHSNRKIQMVYPIRQQHTKESLSSILYADSTDEIRPICSSDRQRHSDVHQQSKNLAEMGSKIAITSKPLKHELKELKSGISTVVSINGINSHFPNRINVQKSHIPAEKPLMGTKSLQSRNNLKLTSVSVNNATTKNSSHSFNKNLNGTNMLSKSSSHPIGNWASSIPRLPVSNRTRPTSHVLNIKTPTHCSVSYSSESFSGNWKSNTPMGTASRGSGTLDKPSSRLPLTEKIISIGKKAGRAKKREPPSAEVEHNIVVSAHTAYREALIM